MVLNRLAGREQRCRPWSGWIPAQLAALLPAFSSAPLQMTSSILWNHILSTGDTFVYRATHGDRGAQIFDTPGDERHLLCQPGEDTGVVLQPSRASCMHFASNE